MRKLFIIVTIIIIIIIIIILIVKFSAHFYDGDKGSNVRSEPIPEKFLEFAKEKQQELIMAVADVDDEFAELILSQEDYTPTRTLLLLLSFSNSNNYSK